MEQTSNKLINSETMRNHFKDYILSLRIKDSNEILICGDSYDMIVFFQKYYSLNIESMYDLRNHKLCESARLFMQLNEQFKGNVLLSQTLKHYASFLENPKFNPELNSQKIKKAKDADKKPQIIIKDMTEGGKVHTEYERRYRNPELRKKCIEEYGFVCHVCGFDFAKAYGEELGGGFIEVHHLEPISTFAEEHEVDPLRDLVPLCSNCHSMIHHGKNGTLTLNELREAYKGKKWDIAKTKEQ